jgi:heme exporter protein C
MAASMVAGMLVMVFAFWMYSIAAVLHRARSVVLEREKRNAWAQQIAAQEALVGRSGG